jgi:hypothetical protein
MEALTAGCQAPIDQPEWHCSRDDEKPRAAIRVGLEVIGLCVLIFTLAFWPESAHAEQIQARGVLILHWF